MVRPLSQPGEATFADAALLGALRSGEPARLTGVDEALSQRVRLRERIAAEEPEDRREEPNFGAASPSFPVVDGGRGGADDRGHLALHQPKLSPPPNVKPETGGSRWGRVHLLAR